MTWLWNIIQSGIMKMKEAGVCVWGGGGTYLMVEKFRTYKLMDEKPKVWWWFLGDVILTSWGLPKYHNSEEMVDDNQERYSVAETSDFSE